MNRLTIEKTAFQVADSLVILSAILSQLAIRHSERLWAVLQDQARVDWWLLRDRLMFDAFAIAQVVAQEAEYLADEIAVEVREIVQVLFLLPQAFYWMQQLDHEIPVGLEAELKRTVRVITSGSPVAGLLPPASTPEFFPVRPVLSAIPTDWDRDRNGRKLSGAALIARQRKYGLLDA